MSKKVKVILLILVFIIGLGLFLYPSITSRINRTHLKREVEHFEEELNEIKENHDFDQLYELMKAYNDQLYEERQIHLNSEEAYEIPCMDLTVYGFENNMVGSLYIERIDLTVPILLGASNENMFEGVTHLSNTSLPIGGINTNCVISGHRGMVSKEMFRNIEEIQIGDLIQITNFWETLTYEVKEVEVVEVTQTENLFIQEGKDMVTLITCHPYQVFNQRYMVYCERVK